MEVAACFRVNVACSSCLARASTDLAVPMGADAPTTVDELVEQHVLERMPFVCKSCDSIIAKVTSVKRTYLREGAAA